MERGELARSCRADEIAPNHECLRQAVGTGLNQADPEGLQEGLTGSVGLHSSVDTEYPSRQSSTFSEAGGGSSTCLENRKKCHFNEYAAPFE